MINQVFFAPIFTALNYSLHLSSTVFRSSKLLLPKKRLMGLFIIGLAIFAFIENAAAQNRWVPPIDNSIYVRNNTAVDMEVVSIVKEGGEQRTPSKTLIPAGKIIEVYHFDEPDRKPESVFELKIASSGNSNTLDVTINGLLEFGANVPSKFGEEDYIVATYSDNIPFDFPNPSFRKYAYITIGDDHFGMRGPKRDPDDPNSLTVTSYNVYMGTATKPEKCLRGKALRDALAAMETDVLVLQEMNFTKDMVNPDCGDGLELAYFLWNGKTNPEDLDGFPGNTMEEKMRASDYFYGERPSDGGGVSPKGKGVFPFISQFTDGPNVGGLGGRASDTGGDVILSKYPVQIIRNNTFNDLEDNVGFEERKGYLVVKITKEGENNEEKKDYYILGTHTQRSSGTSGVFSDSNKKIRDNQIKEIKDYITNFSTNDIEADKPLILAGDWNKEMRNDDILNPLLDGFGKYPEEDGSDTYFADSRRGEVTFYSRAGAKYADWANDSDRIRVFDWNGDGRDDICIGPKKSNGEWYILESDGDKFIDKGEVIQDAYGEWYDNPNRIRVMDWNGDGMDDICIGPSGDGEWYILESDGEKFKDQGVVTTFDPLSETDGDRIRVMDWNGDGKDDICIGPKKSNGEWYILESNGDKFIDKGAVIQDAYSNSYDNPNRIRVMDWNGDGNDDICIGPSGDGEWYILESDGEKFKDQGVVTTFDPLSETDGDRIRVMDWNGDGKDDICIGPKRSNGEWYILEYEEADIPGLGKQKGFKPLTAIAGAFGEWSDNPGRIRVMDWNGDDKDDICIGPSGDGEWYLLKSDGEKFEKIDDDGLGYATNAYQEWNDNSGRIRVMDWNGDGKDDICLGPDGYGTWSVLESSGFHQRSRMRVGFGTRQIDWVLYSNLGLYQQPDSMTVHAFPVRNVDFKYVDLSDHLAVTATFHFNSVTTGIGELQTSASEFAQVAVYPNSADQKATLTYKLTRSRDLQIDLYDMRGQWLQTLATGNKKTGFHEVPVETSRLASGMYVIRLESEGAVQSLRLSVIR